MGVQEEEKMLYHDNWVYLSREGLFDRIEVIDNSINQLISPLCVYCVQASETLIEMMDFDTFDTRNRSVTIRDLMTERVICDKLPI